MNVNDSSSPTRRCTILGAAFGLLALGLPASGTAQDVAADERVDISGRVVDAVDRAPLAGVSVEIAELGLDLRTDSSGEFEIRDIPLGTYELSLSLDGYRRASGNFAVVRSGSFVASLTPVGVEGEVARGRMVGRILDAETGDPLVDAEVRLPELAMGDASDADGRFAISGVPPGRHPVEFSYLGYGTVRDTIAVVADQTSDARVQLSVDPIAVEPIEVTVERREIALETAGFYERRDEGWGRFIDLEEIEEQNPSETTDLLDGMNGVTLMYDCVNALARYVVLRGGRAGGCYGGGGGGGLGANCFPMVVVDGTIAHRDPSTPARIDDLVNLSSIAGVEVYPSSTGVPMQYAGTGSSCGVILVWTRR